MVLLVIDIQKGITDNRLYNFDGFIRETKKVIDAAVNCGIITELFSNLTVF